MQRPTSVSSPEDITDWYWTRAELNEIAKNLGVKRTGSKADLTARLAAHLAGDPQPEQRRTRAAGHLVGPLTLDTVVPDGQRMTREVRDFLSAQIPDFRFDAHMRAFFADPDGRTLGDAVELWHRTRDQRPEPSAQFEYNRFTRAYRGEHPDASREQLLEAWAQYKATPISARGRV